MVYRKHFPGAPVIASDYNLRIIFQNDVVVKYIKGDFFVKSEWQHELSSRNQFILVAGFFIWRGKNDFSKK
ncbi:conserved hypothetical protein [Oenococcus oeni]|uniref:Uncharacterized protein n=1 Tax=Oenococcus oeni TaxID=1247 RepID=A0A483BCL2_OENOE|nr:hypothetical protein X293_09225 [Oenococcus oeni IOEB_C52]OIL38507.1 hypothetical protein ATX11_03690 [Oenococcus oeni]OIM21548.1 hypothetical protein ATX59_03600 [Oenococcus oeni]OIM24111.1 hypothetical protein ATX60_03700 [Oenococcus oeni]OLQ40637.1 hypothetical protein ATX28_03715 [Oenococcus oeni]